MDKDDYDYLFKSEILTLSWAFVWRRAILSQPSGPLLSPRGGPPAVVLIGDSGVGKSNLLSRFTKNEFNLEVRLGHGPPRCAERAVSANVARPSRPPSPLSRTPPAE
jgi:hypothetical protein